MGVKIAVVGGGSTYTPELVDGLATRADRLAIDEIALLDPDADRLAVVGGLSGRILARHGWSGRLVATGDRAAAIEGADFVVFQLRVGGQAARLLDETIPARSGCVGQETTGAGGFAKALRTVPVVLDLAEEVARRASAGAWIVDFTNPVGIVTQALLDAGHRAIGLCNVAIGFQRRFAARFEVAPADVHLDHVGLNHLTWIRSVLVRGIERLPDILELDGETIAADVELPLALMRDLRAIPSYYLRYYYAEREVVAEQGIRPARAEEVAAIERELLELYRDPALDTKPALLEQRGGAYYSEAAAQLVASLHDGAGDVQVVDVRNGGALAGLPPDAVVEVPARIDRDGAHPLRLAPLAPEMLGLVEHVRAYQALTIRAAVSGDRRDAFTALLANPLVRDAETAREILDGILRADSVHLPRFAT